MSQPPQSDPHIHETKMGEEKADDTFDVQATLQTLEQHRLSDNGEALFQELTRPWPGMAVDMLLAVGELISEMMRNGRVPLFMKNLEFDDETGSIAVEFPDWVHVANQAFALRYQNPVEADLRFQKTMAVLQNRLMTAHGLLDAGAEELMAVLKEWLPDWPANLSTRIH